MSGKKINWKERAEFWERQFTKLCEHYEKAKRFEDLIREIVCEEMRQDNE